jgi:hypothetical protein
LKRYFTLCTDKFDTGIGRHDLSTVLKKFSQFRIFNRLETWHLNRPSILKCDFYFDNELPENLNKSFQKMTSQRITPCLQ